ncbi:serine hydrolase domain-containing protein [Cytobacillus purgationiresistens]|uniref:CubicO group peptidase (Beta-lactamase class C family) n=1 Tax=Cytobacillus purgationiresistens TaxID=863449 RepID=A0ABU0AA59_9BACI|nr:serine hydrolase domain-containing protein [Cytobacillus purgationiresistens]MDQ0268139.1 CubicO group peptidase (beta-lactamase class C family) [Cytobacillus purgationiresistens]
MNMSQALENIDRKQKEIQFSGTVCVKLAGETLARSYGFSNRNEKVLNQNNTRYGIASGSKFLTSIAIGQLVDQRMISFDTKLSECLDSELPYFDETITIHHLLTHTSGIPDYFDESVMDNYEDLWLETPMYKIRELNDFLPLFQNGKMVSAVGDRFQYNNAGYVILGLVIEKVSGLMFSDYIEQFIFKKAAMYGSGYYELDALPERTALGYIENPDGSYKTNIYSIPAKGGADGGVFVTAKDMVSLWEALNNHSLMSEAATKFLLQPRVLVEDDIFYGYSGYMKANKNQIIKHILMGYDPGVNFRSVYYPSEDLTIVVCSNESDGAYDIITDLEKTLLGR